MLWACPYLCIVISGKIRLSISNHCTCASFSKDLSKFRLPYDDLVSPMCLYGKNSVSLLKPAHAIVRIQT